MNDVFTSRKIYGKEGKGLFDVNCRAALACIDAGFGHNPLIRFLANMNIPPPTVNTLKLAEKRLGPSFITVAQESFKKAIQEEKELTSAALLSNDPLTRPYVPSNSKNDTVYLSVSYDFGWSTTGFRSKSGRGSLIGVQSKKILAADAFSTGCAMCARGHDFSDHDCCKSWSGSSKAMEAAMGVKLMLENEMFVEAGVQIGTFIGDDDACTYSAVQRQAQHSILKLSDANHVRKKFGSELYKLASVFKELRGNLVIPHLKKCFNYALDQNRNNSEAAKKALSNIVNHIFGIHKNCGDWCKAKNNPNYIYRSFPKGEPLKNENLKITLKKTLESFTSRIVKIAHGGSSQPNESFNHMVASKYPKSRHYAESNSFKFRTAAAAAHKNIGAEYINIVFVTAGLPSGCITKKYCLQREALNKKRVEKQNTINYKRKRCENKLKKHRQITYYEKKEGISYKSSTFTIPLNENETEECYCDDSPFIMVDIETTSLYETADILQIAAISGDKKFVRYMFPTQRIDEKASDKNGFIISDGNLYQRDKLIVTTPPATVGFEFLEFLEMCGPKAILVGHNVIKFDAPRIIRWLVNLNLFERFRKDIYGFVDSLPLINQGKVKKLDELAQITLITDEWKEIIKNAHDALIDCQILDALLTKYKIDRSKLISNTVTIKNLSINLNNKKKKKLILETLEVLIDGGISKYMVNKIATADISIEKLCDTYKLSGEEGIKLLLGKSIMEPGGRMKPVVTTSKKIIDSIIEIIEKENKKTDEKMDIGLDSETSITSNEELEIQDTYHSVESDTETDMDSSSSSDDEFEFNVE